MKPKARYDQRANAVILDEGSGPITISLDGATAIFEAMEEAAAGPSLSDPGGIHYPTAINAIPADGQLSIYMEFVDGSKGQFVFPAPGKSQEQVALASEAIRSGFAKLFSTH